MPRGGGVAQDHALLVERETKELYSEVSPLQFSHRRFQFKSCFIFNMLFEITCVYMLKRFLAPSVKTRSLESRV